jgi:hypothetical protein
MFQDSKILLSCTVKIRNAPVTVRVAREGETCSVNIVLCHTLIEARFVLLLCHIATGHIVFVCLHTWKVLAKLTCRGANDHYCALLMGLTCMTFDEDRFLLALGKQSGEVILWSPVCRR